MKHVSVQEKLRRIGNLKYADITHWEWEFITGIAGRTYDSLSEKQWAIVEQIFSKHFEQDKDDGNSRRWGL